MNYPENWPDGYCQVQPEPGAHCFELATRILREPYTPAAFKVACCPEHAESLKQFGYSLGEAIQTEILELPTCSDCSEPSAELTEVDDSDRSVGHYSILELCQECLKRRMS